MAQQSRWTRTEYYLQSNVYLSNYRVFENAPQSFKGHIFIAKDSTRQLQLTAIEEPWGQDNTTLYKYLDYTFRLAAIEKEVYAFDYGQWTEPIEEMDNMLGGPQLGNPYSTVVNTGHLHTCADYCPSLNTIANVCVQVKNVLGVGLLGQHTTNCGHSKNSANERSGCEVVTMMKKSCEMVMVFNSGLQSRFWDGFIYILIHANDGRLKAKEAWRVAYGDPERRYNPAFVSAQWLNKFVQGCTNKSLPGCFKESPSPKANTETNNYSSTDSPLHNVDWASSVCKPKLAIEINCKDAEKTCDDARIREMIEDCLFHKIINFFLLLIFTLNVKNIKQRLLEEVKKLSDIRNVKIAWMTPMLFVRRQNFDLEFLYPINLDAVKFAICMETNALNTKKLSLTNHYCCYLTAVAAFHVKQWEAVRTNETSAETFQNDSLPEIILQFKQFLTVNMAYSNARLIGPIYRTSWLLSFAPVFDQSKINAERIENRLRVYYFNFDENKFNYYSTNVDQRVCDKVVKESTVLQQQLLQLYNLFRKYGEIISIVPLRHCTPNPTSAFRCFLGNGFEVLFQDSNSVVESYCKYLKNGGFTNAGFMLDFVETREFALWNNSCLLYATCKKCNKLENEEELINKKDTDLVAFLSKPFDNLSDDFLCQSDIDTSELISKYLEQDTSIVSKLQN
ncbi:hypothetical protein RFI_02985 [Reticulomyxa filosa]|uniref:Uncharacterized protein n=1 Tax=Reticulomyxa filosa TaxID=46433 RepID=X6P6F5_RETFI|nr:hypothetical protein RFI_02985 [Reticulomyxa filosa]|eukprot:ETO34110.1 hypothetical protein RFI_02985 [Reticulomyxa filosa]